jgi:hypothetical protein
VSASRAATVSASAASPAATSALLSEFPGDATGTAITGGRQSIIHSKHPERRPADRATSMPGGGLPSSEVGHRLYEPGPFEPVQHVADSARWVLPAVSHSLDGPVENGAAEVELVAQELVGCLRFHVP